MSEDEIKKIDKNMLLWFYRLILKIPGAKFLETSASGIFWFIIMPILLTVEFFLSMLLLVFFPPPINIVLISMIPVAVLLVFARIDLERLINLWNSTVGESNQKWDIEKTMQEYIALILKKEKKTSASGK